LKVIQATVRKTCRLYNRGEIERFQPARH